MPRLATARGEKPTDSTGPQSAEDSGIPGPVRGLRYERGERSTEMVSKKQWQESSTASSYRSKKCQAPCEQDKPPRKLHMGKHHGVTAEKLKKLKQLGAGTGASRYLLHKTKRKPTLPRNTMRQPQSAPRTGFLTPRRCACCLLWQEVRLAKRKGLSCPSRVGPRSPRVCPERQRESGDRYARRRK